MQHTSASVVATSIGLATLSLYVSASFSSTVAVSSKKANITKKGSRQADCSYCVIHDHLKKWFGNDDNKNIRNNDEQSADKM